MDKKETSDLFLKGREAWIRWAGDMTHSRPATSNTSYQKWKRDARVEFENFSFAADFVLGAYGFPGDVTFRNCRFAGEIELPSLESRHHWTFQQCGFQSGIKTQQGTVNQALTFSHCTFSTPKKMSPLVLDDTSFSNSVVINYSNVASISLKKAIFSQGIDISYLSCGRADFSGSHINHRSSFLRFTIRSTSNFWGARLAGVKFEESKLHLARFQSADISGARFHKTSLIDANFTGATFDQGTSLENSKVQGCVISRIDLDTMDNFGGLTVGARMSMSISDDTADLRQSYSGFFGTLHTLSLFVFCFPYLWFLLQRWYEANLAVDIKVTKVPLWQAFVRYVYSGGEAWRTAAEVSLSFYVFLAALLLNGLRVALLLKTKQLERVEEVTGVPARFSLNDKTWFGLRWRHLAAMMTGVSILFVLITLYNTYNFSRIGVPV
ncbi:pentapeptide repeat-containing protein [uncultured Tateyamaria sp.]|uniref:pentapeptide repeat-containing protein n=1 Tax=uncultured Tateyamaria sp. TaxID=455651 RepID=UPI0026025735|nr:pentapeptide repeat-containing protein [uncultured Tateyamaria sp.]